MNKEDKQKILAEIKATGGFKIWPEPLEGQEYGPTKIQAQAFNIPHQHPLDIVLFYGGGRAGKTVSACAAGLSYLLKNPGIDIMVGCEEYTHLEKTALNDYRKKLSIRSDWDHPYIGRKPTSHHKRMRMANSSTAWFMHFSDFTVLRGIELAFAHIEEASLLKDKAVFGEIIRRLSSTKVKQRQLFVTSNPEEVHGWLYDTFSLAQFEPGYDGSPMPIGKPCQCQFCAKCIQEGEEILWEDRSCPKCGLKKGNDCPGDQQFWRVVLADPKDNPHLPQDYRQTQKQSTSDVEFQLYTEGKVMELRKGKCYENFIKSKNVYTENKPIDPEREMFWNFDFNIAYQCSVIAQERIEEGLIYPDIIDEIVIPNAGPDHVALEWLRRYHNFNQPVNIIFDPAAFNNSIGPDDGMIRVKIIKNILENPHKYGYPDAQPKLVIPLTKKIEGKTKVYVSSRVDSVNAVLDDGSGFRRLHINPRCIWLIRSLEALKWTENNGKPVIDVAVDKAAAKAPDKTIIRTLSHPTDALGYYIAKRFPLIPRKFSQLYGYIPEVGLVKTNSDGEVEEIYEEKKPAEPKIVYEFEDDFTDPIKVSLWKYLELQGAFEAPEDNPFSAFYW